ncbi:MAG: archease [Candidatus Nanohaloarchaea archaeon]
MSYEIKDHTADAKFTATGNDIDEAFSEAVNAFSHVVGNEHGGNVRHSTEIESESRDTLLFDFLDWLIYLQDTENVAVARPEEVEIEKNVSGYRLEATVWVEPLTAGSELQDIKGPTYSEMSVEYTDEGCRLTAVLDI